MCIRDSSYSELYSYTIKDFKKNRVHGDFSSHLTLRLVDGNTFNFLTLNETKDAICYKSLYTGNQCGILHNRSNIKEISLQISKATFSELSTDNLIYILDNSQWFTEGKSEQIKVEMSLTWEVLLSNEFNKGVVRYSIIFIVLVVFLLLGIAYFVYKYRRIQLENVKYQLIFGGENQPNEEEIESEMKNSKRSRGKGSIKLS
eukprot:TRINITY_DN7405_c0_g1_i4.p1 TRINITY_DN7405_c0_g1~~TRINITY_DN7405_c0_g1_i4.p1  ORF type:complete len:202 (-),score=34.01 TRINITY_DN7405_c0_g1_i4:57-662(-)